MTLHEVFTMTEQEIYDDFICLAIERDRDYEFVEGKYLWIKAKKNQICFTSHVDTVDFESPKDKTILEVKGIITAWKNGNQHILGADDRAGVYIIYEMFALGYDFHIQLFSGEEVGGKGSNYFVSLKPDLTDIKMYISLDSPLTNRYIWYGDADKYEGFLEYISSFGFKNDGVGIFTDLMTLTEYYDVPALNFSVGYYNQHTTSEYLDVDSMNLTIKKVERIIIDITANGIREYKKVYTNPYQRNKIKMSDFHGDTYQKFW